MSSGDILSGPASMSSASRGAVESGLGGAHAKDASRSCAVLTARCLSQSSSCIVTALDL
ncbi:hypothetical protein BDR03DRAFT_962607, partial [Suillus americanus]